MKVIDYHSYNRLNMLMLLLLYKQILMFIYHLQQLISYM